MQIDKGSELLNSFCVAAKIQFQNFHQYEKNHVFKKLMTFKKNDFLFINFKIGSIKKQWNQILSQSITWLGGVKSENLSPSFSTFSVSIYLSLPKSLDISPAVIFDLISCTTNTFYSMVFIIRPGCLRLLWFEIEIVLVKNTAD